MYKVGLHSQKQIPVKSLNVLLNLRLAEVFLKDLGACQHCCYLNGCHDSQEDKGNLGLNIFALFHLGLIILSAEGLFAKFKKRDHDSSQNPYGLD